jgi:hypothetical protein
MSAFKSHLAECQLPDEVIDAYATAFYTASSSSFEPNPSAQARHGNPEECSSRANRHI